MVLRCAQTRFWRVRRIGKGATSALAFCLAVSGCMTLGDTTTPPDVTAAPPVGDVQTATLEPALPAVPPKPRARRMWREAAHEPAPPTRDKVVTINPDSLIGMSPSDVRKLMGMPTQVRDDHLSREWVYASPGCNFRVFFYPNLNAASFRALKYGGSDGNGAVLAVSDACVRKILTARANATD